MNHVRMTAALAAFLASASLSLTALAGPPTVRAPMRVNAPARVPTASAPAATTRPAATTKPAVTAKSTATTQRTGQPNQSCGSATAPETPGNAAAARGSAFNPNGIAGQMYAGQQPQNSGNPKSVSQYDVACSHQK
jgi:hypothetical protein